MGAGSFRRGSGSWKEIARSTFSPVLGLVEIESGHPTSSTVAFDMRSAGAALFGSPNCFSHAPSRCCCSFTVSESARNESASFASELGRRQASSRDESFAGDRSPLCAGVSVLPRALAASSARRSACLAAPRCRRRCSARWLRLGVVLARASMSSSAQAHRGEEPLGNRSAALRPARRGGRRPGRAERSRAARRARSGSPAQPALRRAGLPSELPVGAADGVTGRWSSRCLGGVFVVHPRHPSSRSGSGACWRRGRRARPPRRPCRRGDARRRPPCSVGGRHAAASEAGGQPAGCSERKQERALARAPSRRWRSRRSPDSRAPSSSESTRTASSHVPLCGPRARRIVKSVGAR